MVLHGFGGMGKTTLAAEAGRWLYRTRRFPGGAAFVSFEHGGSLQQLCSWVGQAVSGDPDFVIGDGDPVARIARLLQEKPALVILDNFESVLGRSPLMPAEELKAVLDAVCLWATSNVTPAKAGVSPHGSRLLITTRDTNFNDSRFSPSQACRHVALQGLAPHDALELAAVVLETNGIDRAKVSRQDLQDLMERLGGHPLSLNLVLPHLQKHTAAELSARFEALLPGFKEGAAKERNESLEVSLQFSLQRLGEATRAALPDLAVFQGGAMENSIIPITQMNEELWQKARKELEQAALLIVENLPNLRDPYLRFHPTLLPYLETQLPETRRVELEERYWRVYRSAAEALYELDTKYPREARAIAVRELPNLLHAIRLAMTARELDTVVDFAYRIAKFLDGFGRWRERDFMMKTIEQLANEQMKGVATDEGKLSRTEYLMMLNQGDALLQQGFAANAEQAFHKLLKWLESSITTSETAYYRATTYAKLGRCLGIQGRAIDAIEWHIKAIRWFEPLSKTDKNACKMLGTICADLAADLTDLGRFEEAQQVFNSGLEISKKIEDHAQVAVTIGQMGTLALQQNHLAEAKGLYTEALERFQKLTDLENESAMWHQLGRVAEEAGDWDEAERYYREAVRLKEQIGGDLLSLALTYNNLGRVANAARRIKDAERWYLRTIELSEKIKNPKLLAGTFINLADLYLSQDLLNEAEQYTKRAIAIMETIDLSIEPWRINNLLARIAQAKGNARETTQ
ncbi:tetratricopeptide repeat protein [candidate division KSB1 bacterium]|nr:tetratricopeptide repeat protein [candidate division KSB1 bacterium]